MTKVYPVSRISSTYNFFTLFSPIQKIFLFYYIGSFDLVNLRRRDRVVDRVVVGKIMIPGSSFAADNFFSSFFAKKLLILFLKITT